MATGAAEPTATSVLLSDEAKALLTPEHSPRQFVAVLNAQGLGADAVRFIPWALTRREAVWWAAQCVRSVNTLMENPLNAQAIKVSEKWCESPTDENRRAALAASELAEISTPAGCVAMAVFFSEGNLAPLAAKVDVPPPPQIGPNMAGNAVLLAAVMKNPEKALEKYASFVSLADEVANGTNRWSMNRTPEVSDQSLNNSVPAASQPTATSDSKPSSKVFPPYPQPKR